MRQKLCEWVVETSYPHIEELYSKGLDTWPLISYLFFLLASYHGLVESFLGLTLFICFSVACSLRATKAVYAPFALHMDAPILYTQRDSTYGFQSKRYVSLAYNHLKELDDLRYPKNIWLKVSHILFFWLGLWQEYKEWTLSITCQNTELSVYSLSLSSWEAHSGW